VADKANIAYGFTLENLHKGCSFQEEKARLQKLKR